ncbi:hypothetical protein E2C01_037178 [Portunus trituberculatus]|uniref:Uncharacterized protein n=1 Tax=Portunus trituberculatus TaxID=210409 RepID=A0A5B7FE97_PORTR|nr:hypothetical protein [Portunus trituberculatus]
MVMVLAGLTTATTACPRRQLPRPAVLALGATLTHNNAGERCPTAKVSSVRGGAPMARGEHRLSAARGLHSGGARRGGRRGKAALTLQPSAAPANTRTPLTPCNIQVIQPRRPSNPCLPPPRHKPKQALGTTHHADLPR